MNIMGNKLFRDNLTKQYYATISAKMTIRVNGEHHFAMVNNIIIKVVIISGITSK